MAGKLQFTLEEYQDAARKYRKDLLMLPIIGIQDTLKFMTGRPGIRYKESVAALNGNAQFAPYKPSRRSNFNLDLDFRTLETFFGSVVAQFEPNSAISTLLGARPFLVPSATQRATARFRHLPPSTFWP